VCAKYFSRGRRDRVLYNLVLFVAAHHRRRGFLGDLTAGSKPRDSEHGFKALLLFRKLLRCFCRRQPGFQKRSKNAHYAFSKPVAGRIYWAIFRAMPDAARQRLVMGLEYPGLCCNVQGARFSRRLVRFLLIFFELTI